jgi:o-succinylbenzoate synthase
MQFGDKANKMDFRFAYRRYNLSFRSQVRTAHGIWLAREGLYVQLVGPDGIARFGEASPIPTHGSESVDKDEGFCRSLGDRIDETTLERIPEDLFCLRNAMRGAIGSPRSPIHQSLGVAALLPAGKAALDIAPAKAEMGFRVFKWKVGVAAADDEMAMFDDLIAAVPSGSRFRLDANGSWNARTAMRWLDRCVDRPVEFLEQPVSPESKGAADQLMGLSADYPIPLALDESIGNDREVVRWMDAGWPGYFVIKPALLGDAAAILGRLAASKAKVVFSSSLETAIGARAALAEAFAFPGETPALGFGVWPLFAEPAFDGPFAVPFLRVEDIERVDPLTLWNAAN